MALPHAVYAVDRLLKRRLRHGQVQYLVRWTGALEFMNLRHWHGRHGEGILIMFYNFRNLRTYTHTNPNGRCY
jgi:hypothetical protein